MELEKIRKFAREECWYDNVEYLFKLDDYDVYMPVVYKKHFCLPNFILVKDDEIRINTLKEQKKIASMI